jgi:hypothetical protein
VAPAAGEQRGSSALARLAVGPWAARLPTAASMCTPPMPTAVKARSLALVRTDVWPAGCFVVYGNAASLGWPLLV